MDSYKIYPKQFRNAKIPIEKNRCFFVMPFSDDFDIVYGDYDDYVSTRRRMIIVPDKDLLTQEEIDELINMIK